MPATPLVEAALSLLPSPGACVVFDIDNTVADTRYRTLHVAHAFDAARGTHYFDSLAIADVRLDGAATARALGLDEDVACAFQDFWASDGGFWCPDCFCNDRPLQPVATIAARAHGLGLEVIWLTGRVEALRTATLSWFARYGLPEQTLVCKPDLSHRTARFKADFFAAAMGRRDVRFFMTESAGDIAVVNAELPSLQCILVDFPFRESSLVSATTPLLSLL